MYLEKGIVDIWEAEDTDIDDCLLMMFCLPEETLEAVDSRSGLRDDLTEDFDVDLGTIENVLVRNEVPEPCADLHV